MKSIVLQTSFNSGRRLLLMVENVLKQRLVIQLGGRSGSSLADMLGEEFRYCWLSDDSSRLEPLAKEGLLNEDGKLNRNYKSSIFILRDLNLIEPNLARELPANQVLVERSLFNYMSEEIRHILELKGAVPFDSGNEKKLFNEIRLYWYSSSDGYRYDPRGWYFNYKVLSTFHQVGNVYRQFELDLGDKWEKLAYPDHSFYLPQFMADKVSLDYKTYGEAEIALKIIQIDLVTGNQVRSYFAKGGDLKKSINVVSQDRDTLFQIVIYSHGKGHVHLGALHIRRSRGSYGEMLINDRVLTDRLLNGNVGVYFNSGDLRPPLNVYFSGYRTKEGFEGNRMMSKFESPFLLIADWRLEGGAFYMGDEDFEKQITDVILETLRKLHFKRNDLILSGMSMGTYGALYYGARLNPKAIILGKPLAQVGTIAQNGRVKRPNDFRTGADIQLYFEGNLTKEASEKLNNRFWQNFEDGDFSDTTFAIAYMKQDDYDAKAFYGIRELFLKKNPHGKILSKGFVGRHNDQTGEVVKWFQRQYKVLMKQFGRNPRVGGR